MTNWIILYDTRKTQKEYQLISHTICEIDYAALHWHRQTNRQITIWGFYDGENRQESCRFFLGPYFKQMYIASWNRWALLWLTIKWIEYWLICWDLCPHWHELVTSMFNVIHWYTNMLPGTLSMASYSIKELFDYLLDSNLVQKLDIQNKLCLSRYINTMNFIDLHHWIQSSDLRVHS